MEFQLYNYQQVIILLHPVTPFFSNYNIFDLLNAAI